MQITIDEEGVCRDGSTVIPEWLAKKLVRTGVAQYAPIFPVKPRASMSMRRDELIELADELGVEYESDDNKADILAKIEAAG